MQWNRLLSVSPGRSDDSPARVTGKLRPSSLFSFHCTLYSYCAPLNTSVFSIFSMLFILYHIVSYCYCLLALVSISPHSPSTSNTLSAAARGSGPEAHFSGITSSARSACWGSSFTLMYADLPLLLLELGPDRHYFGACGGLTGMSQIQCLPAYRLVQVAKNNNSDNYYFSVD